jgi:hypothetical protein
VSTAADIGLLLALASTAALNWGFFTQHGAAGSMPPLQARRPISSLRLLASSPRWLAGFLVGLAGWALYIVAVKLAPLSLVQAVSAGGLGLLALLQRRSSGARATVSEWRAVTVAVGGLVLLAASLAGGSNAGTTPTGGTVVLWLTVLALIAAAAAVSARVGVPAAAALGAAAGILYATGDIATKDVVVAAGLLLVPVVLAAHGLAFVSLQLGFQRGGVLVTVGLATLLTNALPIAAGTALFGESLPGGAAAGLRIAAFAFVTVGAAMLARPPAGEPASPGPSWNAEPGSADGHAAALRGFTRP